jgi:hypothetical protein
MGILSAAANDLALMLQFLLPPREARANPCHVATDVDQSANGTELAPALLAQPASTLLPRSVLAMCRLAEGVVMAQSSIRSGLVNPRTDSLVGSPHPSNRGAGRLITRPSVGLPWKKSTITSLISGASMNRLWPAFSITRCWPRLKRRAVSAALSG